MDPRARADIATSKKTSPPADRPEARQVTHGRLGRKAGARFLNRHQTGNRKLWTTGWIGQSGLGLADIVLLHADSGAPRILASHSDMQLPRRPIPGLRHHSALRLEPPGKIFTIAVGGHPILTQSSRPPPNLWGVGQWLQTYSNSLTLAVINGPITPTYLSAATDPWASSYLSLTGQKMTHP